MSETDNVHIEYLADHKEARPLIAGWLYDEWSFLYPGWRVRDFIRMISHRANRDRIPFALLAYLGHEPAGTVTVKRHDKGAPRRLGPWITSLYVREDLRKMGIGSRLMAAAEEKAHELGEKNLFLLTYQLEPYYSRLGWMEREHTFHEEYKITIMSKRLG